MLGFGLPWDSLPLPSFFFLPFGMGMSLLVLLVLQVHVTICSDSGAQKIKSDTVSTVSPSISHEVMGPDAMILVFFLNVEL